MSGVRSRWAAVGAAVAVTLGAGGLVSVSADSVESVFVAVTPTRVLDTRSGVGLSGVFTSGVGRKIDVTGSVAVVNADGSAGSRVVVPEGATAIVGNLTAVSPGSRGFVSIRPGTASGVPTTSNINIPSPGVNVPNAVTVELPTGGGSAGRVELFYKALDAGASTHLLLDIVGYYVEGTPGPPGQDGVRLADPVSTTLASTGLVGDYASVTVGRDGNPIVSYRDFNSSALRVAVCADPECSSVVRRTIEAPGQYFTNTSITVGADGNPVISYMDETFGDDVDLKLAVCADPTCSSSTRTVINSDRPFGTTSVAIGADGNPVVSFQWSDVGDLGLVRCTNPTCTTSVALPVDTVGNVGAFSSVAIGVDGNPVISYFDADNEDLELAVCNNPTCSSSTKRTLDTAGHVGAFSSLAIGVDGNPIVSHWDVTNGDLKVAACSNPSCSTWTNTTVDAAGNVGSSTSLVIGADGNPVISYHDETNGDLKVAVCANLTCSSAVKTTLDRIGDVGEYSSVTIGIDGNPVISHLDATNFDLELYVCGNTLCSPQIRVGG